MDKKLTEIRIKGSVVSKGIAMGNAFFILNEKEQIPDFPITVGEVDREISRYRQALFSSKEELKHIQKDLEEEGPKEAVSLIDVHIQMLDDPFITTQMEDKIKLMMKNTESVFRSALTELKTQFTARADAFFQERFVDVMDVSERILDHLGVGPKKALAHVPENSILFVKEFIPSYAAAAHPLRVRAVISQLGGGHSHAALIARAKGIPFITAVDIDQFGEMTIQDVIVDAISGEVILNPTDTTKELYLKQQLQIAKSYELLAEETLLPAHTQDGYQVFLEANIGSLGELEHVPANCPVGLFRTEYLFLQNSQFFPTEKQQLQAYQELLKEAKERSVVFRLFDVGGDKNHDLFVTKEKEINPVLGCRGIRFLLKNPDILKNQVRAIFEANGQRQEVKLLLPLISDVREVVTAKQFIAEVYEQLQAAKIDLPAKVLIGCMVEVPSSVLTADLLCKHVDFLSLGTNDLVQYVLGIDRAQMNDLSYPLHPSVLRLIKMICLFTQEGCKPLSICGEIASNPIFIPLLLGLGLKTFSCAPRYLPMIKKMIRHCEIVECYKLAERALKLTSPNEILQLLTDFYKQKMGENSF